MPTMNLMVGNIGTGKSLIARKLMIDGAKVVNMDTIQRMFSGGDYGRYDKHAKPLYHATESAAIETALQLGLDVVIDRTNMDQERRARFIEMASDHNAYVIAYDFGAGDEQALNRRLVSPRKVPQVTWRGVFDYMQSSYEEPSLDEGISEIIKPPRRYIFHAFDFDDVLAENQFPKIGPAIVDNVAVLRKLWTDYSNIIIVWSCRDGDYSAQMRHWMIEQGIPFDFINENPMFLPGSRKIFAHKYYDDRNVIITTQEVT